MWLQFVVYTSKIHLTDYTQNSHEHETVKSIQIDNAINWEIVNTFNLLLLYPFQKTLTNSIIVAIPVDIVCNSLKFIQLVLYLIVSLSVNIHKALAHFTLL